VSAVPIEAKKIQRYSFHTFYEQSSGDKGINQIAYELEMGAYQALKATVVVAAAALFAFVF